MQNTTPLHPVGIQTVLSHDGVSEMVWMSSGDLELKPCHTAKGLHTKYHGSHGGNAIKIRGSRKAGQIESETRGRYVPGMRTSSPARAAGPARLNPTLKHAFVFWEFGGGLVFIFLFESSPSLAGAAQLSPLGGSLGGTSRDTPLLDGHSTHDHLAPILEDSHACRHRSPGAAQCDLSRSD